MKTFYTGLALLMCLVPTAFAQPDLSGNWTAALTPEGMGTFDFQFAVEQKPDTLSIWMITEDGRVDLRDVSLEENRLSFVIPMHGEGVACSMSYRPDDRIAGVCVGPMGESVATMSRTRPADGND